MTTESAKSLKLFYCYAREDKALRDELDKHLSGLKREYHIASWSDGEIIPGAEWQKEIDAQLNTANIILLLISAHFMASHYCYGIEMKRALERHEAGTARVIPIILRRVYWENAPFSKLQVLPMDAKPVTQWSDRDEAFWDITMGIRNAVEQLIISLKKEESPSFREKTEKKREEWLEKGIALSDLKRYDEALVAYEQAIHLDPNHALAWYNKGEALYYLKRYKQALVAYEQTIRLDPSSAVAWTNKAIALVYLKRYKQALAAYEQAIRLDPNHTLAWHGKGLVLGKFGRSEEAQQCYEKVSQLGDEA